MAVVRKRNAPSVSYEPELVSVRALRRGQYGVRQVVDAKSKDDKGRISTKQVIERDAIMRNEGEVFDMDTNDMRKWPLTQYGTFEENDPQVLEGIKKVGQPREMPHGEAEIIKTASGQYELPSWVTLADGDDETGASGHTTRFGNLGELTGNSGNQ